MTQAATAHRCLSLGLQGGGSYGAFTWGVLDRLLEDEALKFDLASGASAGAVNAVVLAAGLAEGGRPGARRKLDRVWQQVSHMGPLAGRAVMRAAAAMVGSAPMISAYQLNPFGLNPLRELLETEVDFARLRAAAPMRLMIAATRVRDGRARLFRETEITLDAVLASACLPLLQEAVEIDGEAYWDGGYSANPPLRQLAVDTAATEILLIRLLPETGQTLPHFSHEIAQRVREIAFNASLLQEQESLEALCQAGASQIPFTPASRKLARLHLHTIAAEDAVERLPEESAMDTSWAFLSRLKERGRAAAGAWLREWRPEAWPRSQPGRANRAKERASTA